MLQHMLACKLLASRDGRQLVTGNELLLPTRMQAGYEWRGDEVRPQHQRAEEGGKGLVATGLHWPLTQAEREQ